MTIKLFDSENDEFLLCFEKNSTYLEEFYGN